jgi:tripartite-type tricarboxylate transporter receptor subunit TctC
MISTSTGTPPRDVKYILSDNSLSYGNAGVNSISNLLLRKTNPKWVSISYKGGAPMFADAIPGTVKLAAASVLQTTTHIQSGKMVPIMVYSRNRMPAYPSVPTSYEMGIQITGSVWIGIVASKSTTDEAASKMSAAAMSAMKDSILVQPLVDRGLTIEPLDNLAFDNFLEQNVKQRNNRQFC